MNTKPELTIFIGQKGIDMVNAHNGNEDKQPAGALFHDVKWDKKPFGKVTFQHGAQSFTVPTVFSVMSTTWANFESQGSHDFDITAGVTPDEFVSHQEAYKSIFAFIDGLIAKGWQPYVSPAGTMLRGQDSLRYYLQTGDTLKDPRTKPSFTQWMKSDTMSPLWVQLYANGVVLSITVRRDTDKLDPTQPGQYIYNMTIKSANAEMRTYVQANAMSEGQAKNWYALWPAKLKELQAAAAKGAENLSKEGYTVDKTYKHPDWTPWLK